MTFEIDVNGQPSVVSVERIAPGRFRVVLDDRLHLVDAVRSGEYGLSLILDGDSAISRDVQVAPGREPGELLVSLEARSVAVALNGARSRRAGRERAAGPPGQQAIIAPMPGRIVRVLVSPGQEVRARQAVIVIEAMKMENELRATRAGRVKEVTVAAGASVDAGRVLAVLE